MEQPFSAPLLISHSKALPEYDGTLLYTRVQSEMGPSEEGLQRGFNMGQT